MIHIEKNNELTLQEYLEREKLGVYAQGGERDGYITVLSYEHGSMDRLVLEFPPRTTKAQMIEALTERFNANSNSKWENISLSSDGRNHFVFQGNQQSF